MNKTKVDVEKVMDAIKENFEALRKGLDLSKLSENELEEISKDFQELKEMALKLKEDLAKI